MEEPTKNNQDQDQDRCCPVCLESTETRVHPCDHLLCRPCFDALTFKRATIRLMRVCPLCRACPIWMSSQNMDQQVADINEWGLHPFVYAIYQQIVSRYQEYGADHDAEFNYVCMMEKLCLNPNPHVFRLIPRDVQCRYPYSLSQNPAAMSWVQAHPDCIRWGALARNPHEEAIRLCQTWHQQQKRLCEETRQTRSRQHENQYQDKTKHLITDLCKNPSRLAMEWLQELVPDFTQLSYTCWSRLMQNPAAIPMIERHMESYVESSVESYVVSSICRDTIRTRHHAGMDLRCTLLLLLSSNPSPAAFHLFQLNLANGLVHADDINWYELSQNPAAMEFLVLPENRNKIDMEALVNNPHPEAMHIIKSQLHQLEEDSLLDVFANPAIFMDHVYCSDVLS